MDSLAEYLQGDYVQDSGEIEQIGARTKRLVEMFLDFFKGGWPYQLSSGEAPREPKDSHSTNAMILFALAAATGRVTSSSLVPAIRLRSLELSDEVRVRLDTVLQEGVDHLVMVSGASKRSGDVTSSLTFGPNDPFTLTWFLELLEAQPQSVTTGVEAGTKPLDRLRSAASNLVKTTFDDPRKPVLQLREEVGEEAVPHAFPLLRVVHLYKALKCNAPPVDRTLMFQALGDRLHLHLSLSEIPNGAFDAGELVFSLEGWLLCHPGSPDTSIIDRTFRVLAARQSENPYWRPLRPFKVTPQGLILLPQSVEIASSLLRICQSCDGKLVERFSDNVSLFRKYSAWLESRQTEGKAGPQDYVGWESEHTYVPGRIHLWQTSQVLLYLQHYAAMLQQHVARVSLRAARVGTERPFPNNLAVLSRRWETWQEGEPVSGAGADYRVYERIGNAFVHPREPRSEDGDPLWPRYSMLLYGPPGTGKSTVAKELARSLGYRLLTITPSDFLSAGPDEIEARAKAIFKMLEQQSDFVILFDEIDRLLLDRDSGWYTAQSDLFQLLTPGMLTKLNDLAKRRRSIFVLATNYRERIDPAIKRAGRIDEQYLVLPPDLAQRKKVLASKNGVPGWETIPEETRDAICRKSVLRSYTELMDLAKEALIGHPKAGGEELGAAVWKVLSRVRPAIRLGAYKTRVDKENEIGDRKPLEELAMLVFLTLEADVGLPAEDPWLRAALEEALKEEVIRDEAVAERLQGVLEPEA